MPTDQIIIKYLLNHVSLGQMWLNTFFILILGINILPIRDEKDI